MENEGEERGTLWGREWTRWGREWETRGKRAGNEGEENRAQGEERGARGAQGQNGEESGTLRGSDRLEENSQRRAERKRRQDSGK